jgi:hypothetical protein
MPDPLPREEFEHFHRDGLKNLEIEKARLAAEQSPLELAPLDADLRATLISILERLAAAAKFDPEQVFKEALGSLDEVDAKRFLIENLLEAVKHGESITKTMKRYQDLGLLNTPPSPNAAETNPPGLGRSLVTRKSIWRRAALAVKQIIVNALKSIPKWVEIEPHVTFLGPLPMLSFALKGKGMSIQELLETLRGPEPKTTQ